MDLYISTQRQKKQVLDSFEMTHFIFLGYLLEHTFVGLEELPNLSVVCIEMLSSFWRLYVSTTLLYYRSGFNVSVCVCVSLRKRSFL